MTEKRKSPALRFRGYTDDWEQRKLSSLCDKFTDGDWIEAKDQSSSGVRLIQTGNVGVAEYIDKPNNKKWVSNNTFEALHCEEVFEGDILISRLPEPAGRACIVPNLGTKMITAVDCTIVRASENTSNEFLLQYLSSQKYFNEVNTCLAGGTRQRISRSNLANFDVSIPTKKKEQEAIGLLFTHLDNLITLHQRKLEKLKLVKKSMLEKMFPKNGSSVPEIRFKGFTDDWEQRKLGDVVKEITRNDPESEAPIMMITANNGFIEQSERYAFNNAGESLKKYILLKKGELAYNHGASKLRPYGSCFALTAAENARIPFVYHCFSAENQNAEFMSIELNGAEIENQLRRIVSSGARMDGLLNISFDEYTSVSVLLPGVEEQDRIADFFRHLDHLITLHQCKVEKLQILKKSMLEKMFV